MVAVCPAAALSDMVDPSVIAIVDEGGCLALHQFHCGQHASDGKTFNWVVLSYVAAPPGKSFVLFVGIIVLAGETQKLCTIAVLHRPIRVTEVKASFAAYMGAG